MHLSSAATLDAAKPHIEAWRERDRAADKIILRLRSLTCRTGGAPKGHAQGQANKASKVCETLGQADLKAFVRNEANIASHRSSSVRLQAPISN
jgi:hypothetical protein